jgi:hypothetical protein
MDMVWTCCRRAAAGPQTLEAVKKEVDKESRFTEKPKDKEAEKKKKEKEKEKEKKKKEKERQKNKPVEDDGWAQVGTPVKRKGKAQTGSGPNSPVRLMLPTFCKCPCPLHPTSHVDQPHVH